MAARATVPPIDWSVSESTEAGSPAPISSLEALEPGERATIVAVKLEDDLSRWLAAIGIGRGDRVTVLRRAPFGGPIHLRTQAGGELAIDRALARAIRVTEESKGSA